MNSCKVVLPKALAYQSKDDDIQREMMSVEEYISQIEFDKEESVYVVPLKGTYYDFEKRMNTVVAFVNRLNKPICELHCLIRISSSIENVEIASMTIDFDRDFLGAVEPNVAVLVHFNIPVKGLTEDRVFSNKELEYSVEDVRITYVDSEEGNVTQ